MTTVCLNFLATYWDLEHKNIVADDSKLAEKVFKKFIVDEYEVKETKVRLKLNKEDRPAFLFSALFQTANQNQAYSALRG